MKQQNRGMRLVAFVVAAALAALVGASVARADVVVTVPADIVAEAQGPAGAQVTYEASARQDQSGTDKPISCTNPDGSTSDGVGTIQPTVLFPLGTTTVTCSSGDEESASFTVTVRDTTPLVVRPPRDITVVAPADVGSLGPTDPTIAAFLAGATASDTVDPNPTIAVAGPTSYPVGTSRRVTFTATDDSGKVQAHKFVVAIGPRVPPL